MNVKVTTIRINETVVKEAKIKCIGENISLSEYIENLIKQDLYNVSKTKKDIQP